ncbi:MAG TPA: nuclear transport factor 2 family protein [Pyrinomonadaceae bacterium]
MKRLLVLAALVAPLWGCAQPAEAPGNTNAPTANTNTAASPATTTAAAPTEAAITDREKAVWDALKRKDYAAFGDMMADEFVIVSEDGIENKQQMMTEIKNFAPTDVTFSDWRFLPIDNDAAVVTYQTVVKGTGDGKPLPEKPERNSSVWIRRGDKWVAVFHQECDVAEAPPPPPAKPAASPAAAANANTHTGGTPDEAGEAADPIAKEQRLWQELKRKDYDAFASDLAENSVEIEPEGVFTKTGSVDMVKKVPFEKLTLSDFKETKIDADASVVTYLVKGGKSDERHSTVWVKRGNKWLALLHHGTPLTRAGAAGAMPAKPAASPAKEAK